MTSSEPRPAGSRGAALIAAVALALLIAAGGAWAQTGGGTPPAGGAPAGGAKAPNHAAHDRTKVPKAQRAEDMVKHGEEMRKKLDDFANGVSPCPKTPQEWEDLINLGAQWKAYQEVRDGMKTEFADQLRGTPLGQRYDKVFDGKKGLARALEARLRACNPPATAIKSPQELLELVARMIDVEKGLAGIIPLAVIDCPDCKREQQRVNTGGSSSGGASSGGQK